MENQDKQHFRNVGFSLIESLISLCLFLIIVLGSLEFFDFTRKYYFKLKEEQETKQDAFAALDKMRKDFEKAGCGLIHPIHLGLFEGINEKEKTIFILTEEESFALAGDLTQGQTKILSLNTKSVKSSSQLCLVDDTKGEIIAVSAVDTQGIVLSSPLNYSYSSQNSDLILLRKVTIFLDEKSHILRRKVNTSPSQPLLEDTSFFTWFYEKKSNLVQLQLGLKEKKYEISVFPKNLALSSID
jgi:type II secretory pathway pseudopilin PulG